MRIICFDVDGTLCYDNLNVDDNIRAKLTTMDEEFVIVSGRTTKALEELKLDYDMIGSNGGEIIKCGKLIFDSHLDKLVVTNIVSLLEDRGYLYAIHTNKGKVMKKNIDFVSPLFEIAKGLETDGEKILSRLNAICEHVYGKAVKVDNIKEYIKHEDITVKKIEVYYQGDKEPLIEELIDNYPVNAFSSAVVNVEIVPEGVNKAKAIQRYVADNSVKIIAIGDGDNDIDMFELADYSIAMGNGTDKLKAVANYVVDDVTNGGFIEALELIENLGL